MYIASVLEHAIQYWDLDEQLSSVEPFNNEPDSPWWTFPNQSQEGCTIHTKAQNSILSHLHEERKFTL